MGWQPGRSAGLPVEGYMGSIKVEDPSLRQARQTRGALLYSLTDPEKYRDFSRFEYREDIERYIHRPPYKIFQELSSQYDIYHRRFYQDSIGRSYIGPEDPADIEAPDFDEEFKDSCRFENGDGSILDMLQEDEQPVGVSRKARDSSRAAVRMNKFFAPYNDYVLLRAIYQLRYATPQQVLMLLKRYKLRNPDITVADSLTARTLKIELKRLVEQGILYFIRVERGIYLSNDEVKRNAPYITCLQPTGLNVLRQVGYGGFYDDMLDLASGYKLIHRLNMNDLVAGLVLRAERYDRFDLQAIHTKGIAPLAEMIYPKEYTSCAVSLAFKPTEEEKEEAQGSEKRFHYLMIEPVQGHLEKALTFAEDIELYYRKIALTAQAYSWSHSKKALSVGIIFFCENREAIVKMREAMKGLYYRDRSKTQKPWWEANRMAVMFTTGNIFSWVTLYRKERVRDSLIRFEPKIDKDVETTYSIPDDEYTYLP